MAIYSAATMDMKQRYDAIVVLKVSKSMREVLERIAIQDDRPMSSVIRRLLAAGLADQVRADEPAKAKR